MKNKGTIYAALAGAVISIVGVTVAYAALQSTLDLSFGKVKSNALSWNVGFDTTAATVAGTAGGTSAEGRSCGTASVTATSVTVSETTLSKPEDSCKWALTVRNSGGITAVLGSINSTAPTGTTCDTTTTGRMVCGNITYTLTTDENASTLISSGATLAASQTKAVYLKAEYTGADVSATTSSQSGAKFTLTYNQQ